MELVVAHVKVLDAFVVELDARRPVLFVHFALAEAQTLLDVGSDVLEEAGVGLGHHHPVLHAGVQVNAAVHFLVPNCSLVAADIRAEGVAQHLRVRKKAVVNVGLFVEAFEPREVAHKKGVRVDPNPSVVAQKEHSNHIALRSHFEVVTGLYLEEFPDFLGGGGGKEIGVVLVGEKVELPTADLCEVTHVVDAQMRPDPCLAQSAVPIRPHLSWKRGEQSWI